jgi:hypothetical protein
VRSQFRPIGERAAFLCSHGKVDNLIDVVETIHLEVGYVMKTKGCQYIRAAPVCVRLCCSQYKQLNREYWENISVIPIAGFYISAPIVKVNDFRIVKGRPRVE